MTTNHHTPIAVGAPANAVTFNAPLGQLDSAIDGMQTSVDDAVADVTALDTTVNNLVSGGTGFTQLSIGTTTALIISSGAITVTRSRHVVDTEASSSYDDLDTILGGVAGDILVLQSLTSARVVVVKHGTGNIFLNGSDVHLDNPRKALTLLYDGTAWVLLGDPPQRIDRRQMGVMFSDGVAISIGQSAVSVAGTGSNSFETDGIYTQYASAASALSLTGVFSTSTLMTQPRYNPTLTLWVRTSTNLAGLRWYIGFHTGSVYGGGDTLPSTGVAGVLFRYSTLAGDTGFRPVTSNGTTQTVHPQLGANLTTNTAYKLQVAILNGVAYFALHDSAYFSTALTMPSSTASFQWSAHLRTEETVAKSVLYKRILLETN